MEAALTLPVICYLVFFLLELTRINIAQAALDAITEECTFEFIATGNTKNFANIIEKYCPKFIINKTNLRYWIRLYVKNGTTEGLAYMCAASPYGGEEIFWPNNVLGEHEDTPDYLDVDNTNVSETNPSGILWATNYYGYAANGGIDGNVKQTIEGYLGGTEEIPAGTAFVLTFVIDYPFSSSFVKMLYSGGSNTKRGSNKGNKYLLWGRGVGIVNDISGS